MFVSRLRGHQAEIFLSIQGEGVTSGTPSVFVRMSRCNLSCSWCFVPETPILMADWSWRSAGDVKIGDCVLAIQRPQRARAHNRLVATVVTNTATRVAPTVMINGVVRCTQDHPFWLTGKDASRSSTVHSGWREVARARGMRALFTTDPVRLERDHYERGWLAGMADGDGCFSTLRFRRGYRRFRLALTDGGLLERARDFAARAGFELRPGTHSHTGFKGRGSMSCLWLTRDAAARDLEAWLSADVEEPSWFAGYLGGILDAEGSLSQGVLRIAQHDGHAGSARSRIRRVLEALRIDHTAEHRGFYIRRAGGGIWRALSLARPAKRSLVENGLGSHPGASRVIEALEPGDRSEDVISLTTAVGSYVAAGFAVKNCDTPYTWDWDRFDRGAESLTATPDEVARRVRELAGERVRNVVLTGGEPLVQQKPLVALAETLKRDGFRVEVETNATLVPADELVECVDQWNVSPKLSGAGMALDKREIPDVLRWFASAPNAWWKLVVSSPEEVDEILGLLQRYHVPRDRVWLMPEATDSATLAERGRWLADVCMREGLRFGNRLHVQLWGDERGR